MSTNIFEVDHGYRAKVKFTSDEYEFALDEIVLFKGEGFIPYDNLRSYRFQSSNGTEKFWLVSADAPLDIWKNYFEPV